MNSRKGMSQNPNNTVSRSPDSIDSRSSQHQGFAIQRGYNTEESDADKLLEHLLHIVVKKTVWTDLKSTIKLGKCFKE